jgi:hypothetical protein
MRVIVDAPGMELEDHRAGTIDDLLASSLRTAIMAGTAWRDVHGDLWHGSRSPLQGASHQCFRGCLSLDRAAGGRSAVAAVGRDQDERARLVARPAAIVAP